MYFGAAYYPEHWPRERWARDAQLMKEANFNVVRMAEFAWSKLEPEEGRYDFSWLDEAIEIMAAHGIKTVLGTPTATPPKWLMDKYPEIYMRDRFGQVRGFGSRRHYCYNSPIYREYTKKIVWKMAEHYGNNPNVIGWQIDNEFGCQDTGQCYCENCRRAFIAWLKKKYGSLEELNKTWGTVFWSQTYTDWEQIILPTYCVCENSDPNIHGHNPGLLLDFYRFSSDSIVSYQKLQIDEIRKAANQPITHNLMGHFEEIDYFDLAKDLDFVSWDNYPKMPWNRSDYESVSMAHDLMRGVKNQNFWVMEQQSGPCGWSFLGDTPAPGQLRLWTYQAIAHGAEGIVYFRWRACTFGAEQYWYGILDHDGVPRRRYREIKEVGQELTRVKDWFAGAKVNAKVAIIKSYDNLWSHRSQPHNPDFNYTKLLFSYYQPFLNSNINADVVSIDCDLSLYKLVVMPAFNLMKQEIKDKLAAYVREGGHLILTFRSGTRNWDNRMTTETLPGMLRDLAGIEVEEFDSLCHGRKLQVNGVMGTGEVSIWAELLKPQTAKVLARYAGGHYDGQAAITVNGFGKGKVYYVGCNLDECALHRLLQLIAHQAGIEHAVNWPIPGVEVVERVSRDGQPYIMVLNHNSWPVCAAVPGNYTDLLTGKAVSEILELEPYGVAVLR